MVCRPAAVHVVRPGRPVRDRGRQTRRAQTSAEATLEPAQQDRRVTLEDPEVLQEPWKVTPRTLTLMANAEIEEAAFCEDRGIADRATGDYHGNVR